jgi:hypothetical protein
MKKAFPDCELTVCKKNGVGFSKETLGNLQQADPESYAQIEAAFASWDDIDTLVGEVGSTSTGHGFFGMARAAPTCGSWRRARAHHRGRPVQPCSRTQERGLQQLIAP